MDSSQESIWHEIDTADYLFMSRLWEPRDNQLSVVLEEARGQKAQAHHSIKIGEIEIEGENWPITPDGSTSVFTLSWRSYISYCVTEEMHGSTGHYEDEKYDGRLIRVYSRSNFLDFIARNTGDHFEDYKHFKLACLNHVVDIVSTQRPELARFSRRDAEAGSLLKPT